MPRLHRTLSVRGYELGPSGVVSLATFARYFEHLRWESSSDPSMDLARFFTNGYRMVVRSQRIELGQPVGVGVPMRLSLWVGRIGRASMDMWHEAHRDGDGALVARGVVTAVYLGHDRRPHPIPEDVRAMVEPADATAIIEPLDVPAPAGAWTSEFEVRPSDLDMFQHVNHAVYAAYYDDARWLGARQGAFGPRSRTVEHGMTRAMAIDYRREVLVGQRIEVAAWALDGGIDELGVELRRKDDGELLSSARLVMTET